MGEVDVNGNAKDPMTVLDSECRLRGISKLRVIDASVMPSITSGNTNIVMLIAETIAKKILRKIKYLIVFHSFQAKLLVI